MDGDWNRKNQDFFDDGPRRDGFDHFFHGGFGEVFDVFQPFREMMQSFFTDVQPEMNHPFGAIEPASPEGNESLNPRDRMFKQADPFENQPHHHHQWYDNIFPAPQYDNIFTAPQFPSAFQPSETEDNDLDDRISSEGLGSMMAPPTAPQRSFFSSFSSRTVRTADGKIEEERTIRDSSGKEERIVRRVLGDQSHIVTTKRRADGGEEVIEDMVNVDENSLPDFNRNWSSTTQVTPVPFNPHQPSHDSSGFVDIFRKFFGYNQRKD